MIKVTITAMIIWEGIIELPFLIVMPRFERIHTKKLLIASTITSLCSSIGCFPEYLVDALNNGGNNNGGKAENKKEYSCIGNF